MFHRSLSTEKKKLDLTNLKPDLRLYHFVFCVYWHWHKLFSTFGNIYVQTSPSLSFLKRINTRLQVEVLASNVYILFFKEIDLRTELSGFLLMLEAHTFRFVQYVWLWRWMILPGENLNYSWIWVILMLFNAYVIQFYITTVCPLLTCTMLHTTQRAW